MGDFNSKEFTVNVALFKMLLIMDVISQDAWNELYWAHVVFL